MEAGASYSQVLEKLCAHGKRNALVVEDVHEAVTAGCTPLVVSKRKDHARMLHHALRSLGLDARLLVGEGTVSYTHLKAVGLDVPVLDEAQLLNLLETGEVPREV